MILADPIPRQSFSPDQTASQDDIERQGSLVLPGYGWERYLELDKLFQDSGVRVRYLDYFIEIKAPISESHEEKKIHVSRLVEAWCLDRDIEMFGRGSATLKIPEEAGGEPDESYYFHKKKERPDLVIEIALSSGGLSKRAFYAKFQIPEIWIWRNGDLEVHLLNSDSGSYERSSSSQVLEGIDMEALNECSKLPSINQAVKEFRKLTSGN